MQVCSGQARGTWAGLVPPCVRKRSWSPTHVQTVRYLIFAGSVCVLVCANRWSSPSLNSCTRVDDRNAKKTLPSDSRLALELSFCPQKGMNGRVMWPPPSASPSGDHGRTYTCTSSDAKNARNTMKRCCFQWKVRYWCRNRIYIGQKELFGAHVFLNEESSETEWSM